MNTSENTILITGGTSGIGLALAEEFLKLNNKVIICGRREDRLHEIKQKHPKIIIKNTNIADADQRAELAAWTAEHYPEINILVNNAGMQLHTDLTSPVDVLKLREETETNFIAPIHLASLFVPLLDGADEPTIINISSGLAFAPIAFMPIYCATKAAIHSWNLSLRYQLKEKGIAVFEIIPPMVDTELGHQNRDDKNQSHGGMAVDQFAAETIEALQEDVYEAAIGEAANLHERREQLFPIMNK